MTEKNKVIFVLTSVVNSYHSEMEFRISYKEGDAVARGATVFFDETEARDRLMEEYQVMLRSITLSGLSGREDGDYTVVKHRETVYRDGGAAVQVIGEARIQFAEEHPEDVREVLLTLTAYKL